MPETTWRSVLGPGRCLHELEKEHESNADYGDGDDTAAQQGSQEKWHCRPVFQSLLSNGSTFMTAVTVSRGVSESLITYLVSIAVLV